MARLLLAFVAVSALGSLAAGCGPGPINDRLYPSEWKSKIRSPIPVYKQWRYEGERWERVKLLEGEGRVYKNEEGEDD